ncbi:MAG TPA: hypothetical protein VEG34_18095 [Thermoanaerobaculia bacterium]|nr:hypothetical protein [Thermoanaerobaculia bacterium]
MTHEFLEITRDIADRLEDLKSADDWRSAELAEQIALQAARLDRLVRAEREGAAGRGRVVVVA